jgi:hypothetical protein
VLGTYERYEDAQAVVDRLSDNGFPVERTAIVGSDLRLVEQVTGRLTTGRAALSGAASGAVIGLLLGLLFGFLALFDPVTSALILGLWGLVLGAVLGAIVGAVGHAMTGGRRDFSSMRSLRPAHYDILVDADLFERARQQLDAG